MHPDSQGN
ncbi:hypothetical protein MMR72_31250 [Escherichia coli]|nr:hypothetical protein [Escherichia coli]MCM4638298.1 hypothetical protein [Escherichia coli]